MFENVVKKKCHSKWNLLENHRAGGWNNISKFSWIIMETINRENSRLLVRIILDHRGEGNKIQALIVFLVFQHILEVYMRVDYTSLYNMGIIYECSWRSLMVNGSRDICARIYTHWQSLAGLVNGLRFNEIARELLSFRWMVENAQQRASVAFVEREYSISDSGKLAHI